MKRLLLLALPLFALAGATTTSFAHGDADPGRPPAIRVETLVPDVVGLPEAAVLAGLESVYRLEVVEVPAGSRRDGRVVAQAPAAGERLLLGAALRLEVGRRALLEEQQPLPSVVGLDLGEAERLLLRHGLIPHPVVIRGRHRAARTIRNQHPAAGSPVAPGDEVRIEIAVPRERLHGIRLPSLYGLDPAAATRVLTALGLRVDLERQPSVYETDTVLATVPDAGTSLPAGSAVRLRVAVPARHSRRIPQVAVPDLGRRPLPAIRAAIREAGLRLEIRRRLAPQAPLGRALSQRPAPGAHLPLGAFVRIELPLTAEVPELQGLRLAVARGLVEEAGFALEVDGHATRRGERIVDQLPAAGARAAAGSTVRVVLRSRRPIAGVSVPELRGQTVEAARALLEAAGLAARLDGPRLVPTVLTEVLGQDPGPGTRVPRGHVVTLTFRLRAQPGRLSARVPDLHGLSLSAAEQALRGLGLTARASFVRGRGPRGVTGQQPAAGTLAPRGSEVRITVRR